MSATSSSAPGAPVEFRGIPIGEVTAVSAQVDAKTFEFSAPVSIHLDAQRLGVQIRDLAPGADMESIRKQLVESLVAHGVRAQLQTGSLLTGSLFVAFDFFPDAPPVAIDLSAMLAASIAKPNPGRIYNVADDEPCPPQEVVTYAAQLLKMEPPPEIAFEHANLSPMARSNRGRGA